jgi:hypothetical protein
VVVNVVPATDPPVADVVQVQTARFQFVGGRGGNIDVQTTSGGGRCSAARPTTSSSVPPQIFVRSNFGGASPTFSLQ